MTVKDADFVLQLLNDPGWLEHIGSRDVNTLEDAENYIRAKVIPNYEKFGFGFYIIERRDDRVRVGNCGLARRPGLEHADMGYSLLTAYTGCGYAIEAATAILAYGFKVHGLDPIQAMTTKNNLRSQHLLKKLGLEYEKMIRLPNDNEELMLFSMSAPEEDMDS